MTVAVAVGRDTAGQHGWTDDRVGSEMVQAVRTRVPVRRPSRTVSGDRAAADTSRTVPCGPTAAVGCHAPGGRLTGRRSAGRPGAVDGQARRNGEEHRRQRPADRAVVGPVAAVRTGADRVIRWRRAASPMAQV